MSFSKMTMANTQDTKPQTNDSIPYIKYGKESTDGQTYVDVRLRSPDDIYPTPHVSWLSVFFMMFFTISLSAFYILDFYFSARITVSARASMWLAINGVLGVFFILNSLCHWTMTLYRDTFYTWLVYIRSSHIMITFFMIIWIVFGWIYFFREPFEPTIQVYETYMWFHLIVQSIITVLASFYAYSFISYFSERRERIETTT
jgi:hypothetical protein